MELELKPLSTRLSAHSQWMGGMTNNLRADLKWSRLDDGTPIPYVVFCAQRKIERDQELLLDWGKDCWQAHKQIQVQRQIRAGQNLP